MMSHGFSRALGDVRRVVDCSASWLFPHLDLSLREVSRLGLMAADLSVAGAGYDEGFISVRDIRLR